MGCTENSQDSQRQGLALPERHLFVLWNLRAVGLKNFSSFSAFFGFTIFMISFYLLCWLISCAS